ncbi:MAG TPA: haloacid dehalogenase type II [Candidatus Sulfotelmatobacter sp.]|nr:haloacid dehalogenase type II [Candidatus Sulfotelmatobacter sp.]
MTMTHSNPLGVKALVFDVFGTVVDWRGSIIREGAEWGRAKGLDVDWATFADRWRAGYPPAMDKVRKGELPWMKLDALHRLILNDLLAEFKISGLTEEEKDHWNYVWHRLIPWPDSVEGLTRLKKKFVIATLSNGNVSLLVGMAKSAGLPWDTVFSAELFHHYKPDPETYLGAADLLGCKPAEVMLVAAHPSDLAAARSCGLKTGFVPRPLEHGKKKEPSPPVADTFDVTARDFLDLAKKLSPKVR